MCYADQVRVGTIDDGKNSCTNVGPIWTYKDQYEYDNNQRASNKEGFNNTQVM